jgi:hypothetical protein
LNFFLKKTGGIEMPVEHHVLSFNSSGDMQIKTQLDVAAMKAAHPPAEMPQIVNSEFFE